MSATSSAFADTLHQETGRLQAAHPLLAPGLAKAYAIVAGGRLFPEDDGRSAMVQSSDGQQWYHVNGHCRCPSSTYRNEPCKHRLALRLYQRVADAMREEEEGWDLAEEAPATAPTLPADAVLMIQGKPYVKFIGLLILAHQRGLQSLTVEWTYNDAELSLAHARAVFPFGTFEESGDSTVANVGKTVAPHWRRMSLVRAKARCLRDALGVGACAVEELSEGDTHA